MDPIMGPMSRICYQVAASLDGYIAGPDGEYDWIPHDPDVDFEAHFARFDTFLMGRGTYEIIPPDQDPAAWGRVFVFSTTLRQEDHPGVTVVPEVSAEVVAAIRAGASRDIWLFGGGRLFHALLGAGEVDAVEVAVVPVLLGEGIPLLPGPAGRHRLTLTGHRLYPRSGIMGLEYDVAERRGGAPS